MADITEERLREIIEGTYCGFGVGVAVAAELRAARADLREAVELLRDNGEVRMFVFRADRAREVSRWAMRCGALLEKHKETNQ